MHATIVVINLDRDTSRLHHMRAQLQRLGLAFRRFSAVNGAALPDDLATYFDPNCSALTAGEIGCYASHLAISRDIVEGRLPDPVLVLEDDVELPSGFSRTLEHLLENLPSDWDIVRLSYPSKRATLTVAHLNDDRDLVRYSQAPVSTGAYLINQSGARKLLAPAKRNVPIDHDLRRVWAWKLKTYGVAPPPIRADTFGTSSIDAMTPRARAAGWRSRRIKRQRLAEGMARFRYGIEDFGALRWLAVEALNTFGRLAPRTLRACLFAWAQHAWGWRSDSRPVPAKPSHIHAVGDLPNAPQALQRRTLRRGGRS